MKRKRKNSQHNVCVCISEGLEENNFAGNKRMKECYGQRVVTHVVTRKKEPHIWRIVRKCLYI